MDTTTLPSPRGAVLVVALGLLPAVLAARGLEPSWVREIRVPGAGPVSVRLDRHVYEAARPDLGDLRVVDEQGRPVPHVLQRSSSAEAEENVAAGWSRTFVDDPPETWLTVDLGALHQPLRALVLEVEDPDFRREVRVEAREEVALGPTDAVAPAEEWRPLGDGVVYRREERGELRENRRIDVAGQARVVRLRIEDRGDPPLRVTGVVAVVPIERLVFEATEGGRYELTYGVAGLTAPGAELAPGAEAEARPAVLGPPVRRDVQADVLPWNRRHPVLLWAGLLLVVVGLGAFTWRTSRAA